MAEITRADIAGAAINYVELHEDGETIPLEGSLLVEYVRRWKAQEAVKRQHRATTRRPEATR